MFYWVYKIKKYLSCDNLEQAKSEIAGKEILKPEG